MKTKDFFFDLPSHLIAQEPLETRGTSRLMVLDRASGTWTHSRVDQIASHLPTGALMVFNNSRVRKARVFGEGAGGGRVEVLFTRALDASGGRIWLCMVRKSGSKQPGTVIRLPGGIGATIREAREGSFVVEVDQALGHDWFEAHGHIPLPPYIQREDRPDDAQRYQTVYARVEGSAAAPTAGLHFTPEILASLDRAGIGQAFLTLHVGLGTFAPVQAENIEDHVMHHEEYTVPTDCATGVNGAHAAGRPVVAVGTTSLRTLESAWEDGRGLREGDGSTNIFMYPGYQFRSAQGLFTNFHTPESTLLMLVSAFAGTDLIQAAYAEAIKEDYRFFSYGDAMLIL